MIKLGSTLSLVDLFPPTRKPCDCKLHHSSPAIGCHSISKLDRAYLRLKRGRRLLITSSQDAIAQFTVFNSQNDHHSMEHMKVVTTARKSTTQLNKASSMSRSCTLRLALCNLFHLEFPLFFSSTSLSGCITLISSSRILQTLLK